MIGKGGKGVEKRILEGQKRGMKAVFGTQVVGADPNVAKRDEKDEDTIGSGNCGKMPQALLTCQRSKVRVQQPFFQHWEKKKRNRASHLGRGADKTGKNGGTGQRFLGRSTRRESWGVTGDWERAAKKTGGTGRDLGRERRSFPGT